MKIQLMVGDVDLKSFEIPDDSPTSSSLALTLNYEDGKVLLMRFRQFKKTDKQLTMVLESAFTPADEHISGIERLVKAGENAEE